MGLDRQARLWPTAKAEWSGPDRKRRDTGKPQSDLPTRVSMWPTPIATDGEKAPNHYSRGPSNPGLPMRAKLWPGPDAQVMNFYEEPETFLVRKARQQEKRINGDGMGTPLAMAVKMWPAPISRDHRSGYASEDTLEENARPLNEFVVSMWRTPTASDPKRGDRPDWTPDPKAGEHSLNRQAMLWSTPTVNGNSNRKGSSEESGDGLRTQACDRFSLPDPTNSTTGAMSSSERRTLNPLFVEWLMGWPEGWISFACWEMELFHFKQAMRFVLLQLGLPPEAPPAQLGLFA
jgi:hypothetical protein